MQNKHKAGSGAGHELTYQQGVKCSDKYNTNTQQSN